MSIVVGFDQGSYEPIEGTRQIRLSGLDFIPTIESLLYIFNYTKDKTYFAQAENYAKEVTPKKNNK